MKNLLVLLVAIFTIHATQAKSDNAAIDYNDKIVAEQNKIGEQILAFTAQPTNESIVVLQKQAAASLEVLNSMKPFEKNSELLDAAKKLFKFYVDITTNEYVKVLELLNNSDKYKPEELSAKINEYVAIISQKESILDANFSIAQQNFAKKYGFTLTENKLQEEIDSNNKKSK
jgi:hypothetical protein